MAQQLAATKGGKTISDILTDDRTVRIFQQLLPQHFTPERMVRLAMATVNRTPKLGLAHPMTLLGAFVECAAIGLEPNSPLQHIHLLPFENRRRQQMEVNRIIGYRGFIELGRRTGLQRSVRADVIYEGDSYDLKYGVPEDIFWHVPIMTGGERGKPVAAYCYVKMADGSYAFQVLPWSDVLKARSRSFAYNQAEKKWDNREPRRDSPWHTDEDRMARKTAIRRLYGGGEVPMTIELQQAVTVDERRMDYAQLAQAAQDSADEVKEVLHSFTVDDDGEVTDEDAAQGPEPLDQPAGEVVGTTPRAEPTAGARQPEPQTAQQGRQAQAGGAGQAGQAQPGAAQQAEDDDGRPRVLGYVRLGHAVRAAHEMIAQLDPDDQEECKRIAEAIDQLEQHGRPRDEIDGLRAAYQEATAVEPDGGPAQQAAQQAQQAPQQQPATQQPAGAASPAGAPQTGRPAGRQQEPPSDRFDWDEG